MASDDCLVMEACPLCGRLLDTADLQVHVNAHLDEQQAEEDARLASCLQRSETDWITDDGLGGSEQGSDVASAIDFDSDTALAWRMQQEAEQEDRLVQQELMQQMTEDRRVQQDMAQRQQLERDHMLALAMQNESSGSSAAAGSLHSGGRSDSGQGTPSGRRGFGTPSQSTPAPAPSPASARSSSSAAAASSSISPFDIRTVPDCMHLVATACAAASKDRHYRLCARPVVHYCSNKFDRGWGCGYRNIQMLLSHLVSDPAYRALLHRGVGLAPTVVDLQAAIEKAWAQGWDRLGCNQLGGRLQQTRKWIGACECAALLRSQGIDARVVDFYAKGQQNEAHLGLVEWVWRHFNPSDSALSARDVVVASSQRPPLYFQHQGHSRTIVGIERRSNGENFLLILDPSVPTSDLRAALQRGGWERLVKRGLHTLRMKEYQIVFVNGVLAPEAVEAAKTIRPFEVVGRN
eukprot:m.99664 g.99664  ORF g.99664 m.99664 type:complete len:463 (-) comp15594_c0_seq3:132-1520(-)